MNRNLKHQVARLLCCFILHSAFCTSVSAQTNYVLVHTLTTAFPSGYQPQNSLLLASDGWLYGTTYGGGASGVGTVFKLEIMGSPTILPTLAIARIGAGQAQVSWAPDTGTNWVLQQTVASSPANWTHAPSGTTNPVTVPTTLPAKFYRLFKP
jgi:uncharacterized repeat protein (TIGR03803 family)